MTGTESYGTEVPISKEIGVRAVNRALDLLIELSEWRRPAGLSELAARVGLHPSTAFRLLESLQSRGFVHQMVDDRTYRLGNRNLELGAAFRRSYSVWSQAENHALQLAEAIGETVSIGVLDRGEVLYIAVARGQRDYGMAMDAGTRHPAYCTSLGKAILAEMPEQAVREIIHDHPPVPLTPTTLVDVSDLLKDLAATRRRGFSIDNEERVPGIFCVGAPVRDLSGTLVGALSISGPAQRMHQKGIESLASTVISAAKALGQ
jgi:DNA-binding IclR family transcriptional regulator